MSGDEIILFASEIAGGLFDEEPPGAFLYLDADWSLQAANQYEAVYAAGDKRLVVILEAVPL